MRSTSKDAAIVDVDQVDLLDEHVLHPAVGAGFHQQVDGARGAHLHRQLREVRRLHPPRGAALRPIVHALAERGAGDRAGEGLTGRIRARHHAQAHLAPRGGGPAVDAHRFETPGGHGRLDQRACRLGHHLAPVHAEPGDVAGGVDLDESGHQQRGFQAIADGRGLGRHRHRAAHCPRQPRQQHRPQLHRVPFARIPKRARIPARGENFERVDVWGTHRKLTHPKQEKHEAGRHVLQARAPWPQGAAPSIRRPSPIVCAAPGGRASGLKAMSLLLSSHGTCLRGPGS
ncbi:hypothetical protein [Agrilutibacter solisilvae]|uniref:hypothetical protein n=1 Tax=Agrilutibacter solisilvae TaxID=2763317 RepID=UPI001FD6F622|nr:hypothetical protein [Lysobacter solisilvae]